MTTAAIEHRPTAKGFIKLGLAVLGLWFFVFYAGPAIINTVPGWKQLADAADRNDINTGAIFYTDIPLSHEAELYINSSLRFSPGRR